MTFHNFVLVSRHRTLMNIYDKVPVVDKEAFVAPSASIMGDVHVGRGSSIWYGCVLRGNVSIRNLVATLWYILIQSNHLILGLWYPFFVALFLFSHITSFWLIYYFKLSCATWLSYNSCSQTRANTISFFLEIFDKLLAKGVFLPYECLHSKHMLSTGLNINVGRMGIGFILAIFSWH